MAQGEKTLLGGERGGELIPNFDIGNSPYDYTQSMVARRVVCFTTTNGTKAMMRCIGAGRVLVGTFVNLSSVLRSIQQDSAVELLCAGTNGKISREDVLFAGALVEMVRRNDKAVRVNDQARLAHDSWQSAMATDLPLAKILRETAGGENLLRLGFDRDLRGAAEIDCLNVVPELDLASWRINLGSSP